MNQGLINIPDKLTGEVTVKIETASLVKLVVGAIIIIAFAIGLSKA